VNAGHHTTIAMPTEITASGMSRRRPAEASQTTAAALAFPTSIPVTFALQDMSQELEGVASCFNLVATRSRPLRERLGLALARVGVQRNMRAFQALRILLEDAAPEMAPLSLTSAVEAAARSFGPLPAGFSDDVLPVIFSFDPRLIR